MMSIFAGLSIERFSKSSRRVGMVEFDGQQLHVECSGPMLKYLGTQRPTQAAADRQRA